MDQRRQDDELRLQREASALGDPTRNRLFRYIANATEPVGVAELTDYVRLNHNAVRQHLAVLKEAGLVVEETEKRNRIGRPRLLYRLHPEAAGLWGTPGPYAWLAQLLSQVVQRNEDPRQVGRREGARLATQLYRAADPIDLFEETLARRGFRPTRSERGRRVDFVLGRCPFAEVASEHPETVCRLHLGLAEGLADAVGDLDLERLVPKNARRAGCRVVVRRTAERAKAPA
jgi:predicted ArsR family transcriptional regulator